MRKPQSLRAAIEAVNPNLASNPDELKMYVRDGTVALRTGGSGGYQYKYRLEIDIQNFTGNTNLIMLPITLWLRTNQEDLLQNDQTSNSAIRFNVDVLDAETSDISIMIDLTEAIRVEAVDGGHKAHYRPEAPDFDFPLSDPPALLKTVRDDAGQLAPPVAYDE